MHSLFRPYSSKSTYTRSAYSLVFMADSLTLQTLVSTIGSKGCDSVLSVTPQVPRGGVAAPTTPRIIFRCLGMGLSGYLDSSYSPLSLSSTISGRLLDRCSQLRSLSHGKLRLASGHLRKSESVVTIWEVRKSPVAPPSTRPEQTEHVS